MTETFSTQAELDDVLKFASDLNNSGKMSDLTSTFDRIETTISKNIKWRRENEDSVVNWLKARQNNSGSQRPNLSAFFAIFFILIWLSK